MVKKYSLPEEFQQKIEAALGELRFSLREPKALAEGIKKLSDHYQQETKTTPWDSKEFTAAYIAYFMPLNYLRNRRALDQALGAGFPFAFEQWNEFGFGLGSSLLAAKDAGLSLTGKKIAAHEVSPLPGRIFSKHFGVSPISYGAAIAPGNKNLGVFSYSLNEVYSTPAWLFEMDELLILEPSTSFAGRRLMELRQELISRGYFIWAPCTHQNGCPLLIHSKKDWCHDRLHWDQPEWFSRLEAHLPMKNRTLTLSYLVASKNPPPERAGVGRVVGDPLAEKGKQRWLYCRSDEREFLSWLTKKGDPPDWQRGDLLTPMIEDKRGNELRLS